jgi:hypothetical protein
MRAGPVMLPAGVDELDELVGFVTAEGQTTKHRAA